MESVTIGIDLGTTNTLACYMRKGKPALLRFDGEKMLPSLVYVEKDGSLTIGHEAGVKGEGDPDHLIRSSKTFMGDPRKRWEMRGRTLTPTDVASEILRQVKAAVLKRLKLEDNTVVQAVITVPAYFSGKQRTETKKAGERAGLKVLRIITEPMAAAVAAGREKELKGRFLVVDIGGGTFDLSILDADPQAEEYKAVDIDGDHHLGGDDFDRLLYNYFLEILGEKTGMDFSSLAASGLTENAYGSLRGRLAAAVEGAKKTLSESREKEISIANLFPYKGSSYTFEVIIGREQFDDICQSIYKAIAERLENFLQRQPFSAEKIDSVILAGGSCYIPRIRRDVEKIVRQQADMKLSLDTLVVIGACIVADHEASGIEAKGWIQDIISHSMGVDIIDENGRHLLSKILEKGRPYPCECTRRYTTSTDNQTSVEINIYEAGSDAEDIAEIDSHDLFGSLTLDDIRLAPQGEPSIDVTFRYDKNQILNVTAEDRDTHVRKQILIRENAKTVGKPAHLPVDLMLLMDASGSMRIGDAMAEAKHACYALVDDILDFSVHRLGLVSFAFEATLLLGLSRNQKDMRAKIAGIEAGGGTNLISALEIADRELGKSAHRKAVIIVSDGVPAFSEITLSKAEKMKKRGVRIVAIGVGEVVADTFLQKLANSGDAYKLDNMNELEMTFRTAISAIMEKI